MVIPILPFATWIDLEGIRVSEISETEKEDKYHVISLMSGNYKMKENKGEMSLKIWRTY